MELLDKHIEALVFCSQTPISIDEIQESLSEMFETSIPEEDIDKAISLLSEKFSSDNFAFEICHTAGGYQFLTKPQYQASIGIYLKQKSKKRLSTSALETLAIVAYKQPITKTDIEHIRGVSCDYTIQKLLEKELVEIQGKAETVGRPMLYGTSPKFMEYFGINKLEELPTPKDFVSEANEIGEENEA